MTRVRRTHARDIVIWLIGLIILHYLLRPFTRKCILQQDNLIQNSYIYIQETSVYVLQSSYERTFNSLYFILTGHHHAIAKCERNMLSHSDNILTQFPKLVFRVIPLITYVSTIIRQMLLHDDGIFSAQFKQSNAARFANCCRTGMGFLPPNCAN
jgi:hypothetical protein